MLLVTALALIFAPQLAVAFSSGADTDPVKQTLLVDLFRLTFPFLLFVSLTALAGGALNSFSAAMPALTPVILNLCMIAGALWLAPGRHPGRRSWRWAGRCWRRSPAAAVPAALAEGHQPADPAALGLEPSGVRKVLTLMVPTLFGSSVAQINLLLDTLIAAKLTDGSQSWLSLADRFLELPLVCSAWRWAR